MLHTIQADFYRLFRSKVFWITEAILVLNILSGVIFGATGHVGVNTESKLPQATEVWTGFKALTNYSSSISVTILFTIIVITLVLGTDLTQNLYKNSLAYGHPHRQAARPGVEACTAENPAHLPALLPYRSAPFKRNKISIVIIHKCQYNSNTILGLNQV